MPDVKIRVESVSREETEAQKQGAEVGGENMSAEKLTVSSIFAHQAITTAKQITNYAINNIGNFTGDYVKQERVQEVVGTITDLASIGVAFATSRTAGVIAIIGYGVKKSFQLVNEITDERHAQYQAEYLRQRSGESTKNGSR